MWYPFNDNSTGSNRFPIPVAKTGLFRMKKAQSAPVPASKPQRKIKTVRRADLAKPSRLLSAEDVERYVDDLRSRLMQELAANDEIRIN